MIGKLAIILWVLFTVGGIVYYKLIKKRWQKGNQFIYRGRQREK